MLIVMLSLMSGCQSTIERVDTGCMWVKPISTTAQDRKSMSRKTKEEIAAHNDIFDLKCRKPIDG